MSDSKTTICILSAAFNEGENIKVFYDAVKKITQELPYQFSFCFVNDGSSDNTLSVIKNIASNDSTVKYLSFSRNFGQQVALKAGIDAVFSDAIIMMDTDMQHAPELIPVLINAWKTKNVNMVNTIREEDQELTWFKRCSSKLFYKILNRVSDLQLEPGQADFRLIDKQVVQTLRNSKEHDVFLRGMIHWIGFQQTTINYKAQKRFAGQSKYTFSKMMSLALAGITSFSVKPLYSAIYIGFGFAFLAFLYLPYVIYSLVTGTAVHGWSSVLITISFFGGLNLIIMGVLGIYIGKILIQNKERPLYIIQEENF
ncbi:MAG: glycosyltransferase family 2 protein [Flavobacterium sp.]|nr:glycosyltransferase family 2 protein [Flavobacterium sp.]